MSQRKINPSVGTWALAGAVTAAAVGGIGYAIYSGRHPKKKKKKRPSCPPDHEPKMVEGVEICAPIGHAIPKVSGGSSKAGNYVGAPGYTSWPYFSRYPNQAAFVLELGSLGYNAGNSWDADLSSSGAKAAIRQFQRDYNTLSDKISQWMWKRLGTSKSALGIGKLSVDGLMGDKTINALVVAGGLSSITGMTWKQLVASTPSEGENV